MLASLLSHEFSFSNTFRKLGLDCRNVGELFCVDRQTYKRKNKELDKPCGEFQIGVDQTALLLFLFVLCLTRQFSTGYSANSVVAESALANFS